MKPILSLAALVIPLLLGCASATPPPRELPPLPDAPPGSGPSVHIENARPALPLALYRLEGEIVNTQEVRSASTRNLDTGRGAELSTQYSEVTTVVRRLVCLAPCDRVAVGWPGQEFFLAGEGIAPSARFTLHPSLSRVDIQASPGNLERRSTGMPLLGVGIGLLIASTLFLPMAVPDKNGPAIGGIATTMAAGAGLIGGGIALLVTGRTTYTFRSLDAAAASDAPRY